MFRKGVFSLGDFQGVTLGCDELGGGISFIPDYGGTITTLKLINGSTVKCVLDPISSYQELVSNGEFKNIWLAPFPNRVGKGKYTFDSKDYELPRNEGEELNALHGFIFKSKFELSEVKCDMHYASATLTCAYEGGYPGYPFPFVCTVSYYISAETFATEISLENTGASDMPAGLGWHPYFRLNSSVQDMELNLPDVNSLILDSKGVPTGESEKFDRFRSKKRIGGNQFDHCLQIKTEKQKIVTSLYDPKSNTVLDISQDSNYKFLQVYIPPHRRSIAIEPMTCAADAFNNAKGLSRLKPGDVLRAKSEVTLKTDQQAEVHQIEQTEFAG